MLKSMRQNELRSRKPAGRRLAAAPCEAMARNHPSDSALASAPSLAPAAARRFQRPALQTAALAGLVAALISAACSGHHHAATQAGATGQVVARGVASWYGPGFTGRPTANGERYDGLELTAAHPNLPFGTLVQVTNLDNGRQVVVRINDRGPFRRGRIIDLSYAAARQIDMLGPGTAEVQLAIVGGRYEPDAAPQPAPMLVAAALRTPAPAAAAPDSEPSEAVDDEPAAARMAGTAGTAGATGTAGAVAPAVQLADEPADQPAPLPASPQRGGSAYGQATTAAAVQAEPARSGGARSGARFTVQVGAFSNPERADALQRDLARLYPEAAVRSDGTWSRVQIGQFGDREPAEALRRELASLGLTAIVVAAAR